MKISRKTRQKGFLSDEVKKFRTFFGSEDLFEQAKKKNAGISIATIYRFMNEEVKKGNLHSYQCDRKTVYSKEKQHCQFICQKTGKIIHFDVNSIDFLKDKIPGSIVSFQIEVVGLCESCSCTVHSHPEKTHGKVHAKARLTSRNSGSLTGLSKH